MAAMLAPFLEVRSPSIGGHGTRRRTLLVWYEKSSTRYFPSGSVAPGAEAPLVYDPMVGSGTSLLVAAERGLPALGADLMPYAAFLSATLARWDQADPGGVQQIADDALAGYVSLAGRDRLDVPAADWALSPSTLDTLTKVLCAVGRAQAGTERDLVRLAVLSAVEQVSYAVKDGTSLRRRLPDGPARPGRPGQQRRVMDAEDVIAGVRQRIDYMVADLKQSKSSSAPTSVTGSAGADEERLRSIRRRICRDLLPHG